MQSAATAAASPIAHFYNANVAILASVQLILPDDRSRIIILVAKVQVMVKDDEVENNLAVFADRLSAEQGDAK